MRNRPSLSMCAANQPISTGSFRVQSIGDSGVPSRTIRPVTGRPLPPIVTWTVWAGLTSTDSGQHGMCWEAPPLNFVTTLREILPEPGITQSNRNRPRSSVRVV